MADIKDKLIPNDLDMDQIHSLIAERCILIRKKILKKNQKEMAGEMDISLDWLGDFESGKRSRDIYKLLLYLMQKNIDIRYLFYKDFFIDDIISEREKNTKYKFNNDEI